MKRSPLKRFTTLKQGKPLKRKTKLKPRSAKRAGIDQQVWAIVIGRDLVCRVCKKAPSVDHHHVAERSTAPQHRDNPDACIGVCRKCHDSIVDPKNWKWHVASWEADQFITAGGHKLCPLPLDPAPRTIKLGADQ